MNNNIIRETSSEMRAIARNALSGNWGKIALAVFIFELLSATIPDILSIMIPGTVTSYVVDATGTTLRMSHVENLYNLLLNGALTLGLCHFFLAFFRKKEINHGFLFNGFEYYLKSLGLFLVVTVFTILWSLLFLIPGIIAMLRYSQAFYILADHPEKGIMECFNESKQLMAGNKGKLFALSFSFIGWIILASVGPAIFLTQILYGSTIFNVVISLIAGIPMYFVVAYTETAMVTFYDLVSGNLIAKPAFREEDYYFTPKYIDQEETADKEKDE
ncbi:putative membrane protein [Clostridiales Family XIII bacterium PM5-7]